MIEHGEGAEAAATLEQVSMLLMRMANEAEARDVRAVALASRDAVESIYVLIDVLTGPERDVLARPPAYR